MNSVSGDDQAADRALDAMWVSADMSALRSGRRRFFVMAWSIFASAWLAFIGWPAVFPESFGQTIVPGFSVGMLVCGIYVIVCFALTLAYVRVARTWDDLGGRIARSQRQPCSDTEDLA